MRKPILLVKLIFLAGFGLSACGNWKIGIPGTEPSASAGSDARRAALERVCRSQQLDPSASPETFRTLQGWLQEVQPAREGQVYTEAFARAVEPVIFNWVSRRAQPGMISSPRDLAAGARTLIPTLSGTPPDILEQLLSRFFMARDDVCLPFAIGDLEQRYVRELDPFAQLTFQNPRRTVVPLTVRRREELGYLLAVAPRGSLPALEVRTYTDGVEVAVRRWEDDMLDRWDAVAADPAASRAGVLDLRSAAGLSTNMAQRVTAWAESLVRDGRRILILIDRFTRGQAEVVAVRLADRFPSILLVGEKTLGYVRQPMQRTGQLSADSFEVILRTAGDFTANADLRLERRGAIPELYTGLDSIALSGMRASTLGEMLGRQLTRRLTDTATNPVEIRAVERNRSNTPEPRFLRDTQRTRQIRDIRDWLREQPATLASDEKIRQILLRWAAPVAQTETAASP